jgi:uncharacterized membrane protein YfcA
MDLLLLLIASFIGYVISTVGGGGGSLLLVPVISFLLGSKTVAPILSLGEMISRPVRLIIFWKEIDWKVTVIYVPGALIGSFFGAYTFSHIKLEWLQIIVGLFLISTVFQYGFGEKERSFPMKLFYFIPLSFIVAFLTGLIGATGPVLNPFYLNYGLQKESMVATKTANSFLEGVVQIGTYSFFGALYGKLWVYGIILGIGAGLGSFAAKRILQRMNEKTFRKIVIAVMALSGVVMVYEQVAELLGFWKLGISA